MKITFHCSVDSSNGTYYGDPDKYAFEHEFDINWNGPMPAKGDSIMFNEIIDTWNADEIKTGIFYDRSWDISSATWQYDNEEKQYVPTFWLDKSEK